MEIRRHLTWKAAGWTFFIALCLPLVMVAFPTASAIADEKQDAAQLVEKARFAMENFMNDSMMSPFRDLLKDAKGVLIIPQMLKGAFVFGAMGGNGVFLVRDEKTREWSGPAFYTVAGASFGFQIGAEASEVVLLAMTDRGVRSLLANSIKFGADVGLALGPVGAGVSAATANLSADILSFSRSKGLYGGISLEGAVAAVRAGWNGAYYGRNVTPADIFVLHAAENPQATALIEAVSRSACYDPAAGRC